MNEKGIKKIQLEFAKSMSELTYKLILSLLGDKKEEINDNVGDYIPLLINLPDEFSESQNFYIKSYSDAITELYPLLSQNYKTQAYDVYSLSTHLTYKKFSEATDISFQLLYFTIQIISLEIYLPIEQPNRFESYVLHMKYKFEKFIDENKSFFNGKEIDISRILENKLKFVLFKLDLLIPEKVNGISIDSLSKDLDKTPYKDVKDILLFYGMSQKNIPNAVRNIYLKYSSNEEKTSLEYYFLAKYYKDVLKDITKLETLYNEYKTKCTENQYYQRNLVFIGNNLLSLYVETHDGIINEDIDKLYEEIKGYQEYSDVKNYFTYLKYADYKINILSDYLSQENIQGKIHIIQKEIIELRDKVLENYESSSFFQLTYSENYVQNSIDSLSEILPKIYSPSLIKIGEKYSKDIRVERLNSKIDFLEFIIRQNKNLGELVVKQKEQIESSFKTSTTNQGKIVEKYKEDIEKKVADSRNNQIEILAIFSAVVLFVSGNIQLYTRLGDINSAMVFTLMFGGVVSIILSLVFRTWKIKLANLFIAICLLALGTYYPKIANELELENFPLNINKSEDINKDLKGGIEKAEIINEHGNNINTNLNQSIEDAQKINDTLKLNIQNWENAMNFENTNNEN